MIDGPPFSCGVERINAAPYVAISFDRLPRWNRSGHRRELPFAQDSRPQRAGDHVRELSPDA